MILNSTPLRSLRRLAFGAALLATGLSSFTQAQTQVSGGAPPSNRPQVRQVLPSDVPRASPGNGSPDRSRDVTHNTAPPGTAGAAIYRRPGAPATTPAPAPSRPPGAASSLTRQ